MGIYLGKPNTQTETHIGENEHFEYATSCMQGWRVSMEDAHIATLDIEKEVHLFCIFDGHGGREVAKFCEQKFTQALLANANYKSENYEEALKETFLLMDQMLETDQGKATLAQIKGEENPDAVCYAGCTANVLLIVKNTYYVANAGDARSIIYNKSGNFTPLSHDHKPDLEVESSRIVKAGGYIVDGRVNENLNLTRAIGDLEYKRNSNLPPQEQIITAYPDVMKKQFQEGDEFFVMGCDGTWELLSTENICKDIEELFNKETPIKDIVEQMLDNMVAPDTSDGIGCDNLSLTIVRIKKLPLVQ